MEDDQREMLRKIMQRQDIAYGKPSGTLAQRIIPGVCKHEQIRCCHGDERNHATTRCLICGRGSRRAPMPDMCFFTDQPHQGVSR